MRSKSLTSQFLFVVVVKEVYKVLTQDVEQIVDFPVRGGSQGFLLRQNSSLRAVERMVDSPVPASGGPQLPHPGASISSAVLRGGSRHGVLRTFALGAKSARSAGSSSAIANPHSSSWTLEAYVAENEFFDFEGVSCVGRWIPSWAGYAWWLIVPDRAGRGLFRKLGGTS